VSVSHTWPRGVININRWAFNQYQSVGLYLRRDSYKYQCWTDDLVMRLKTEVPGLLFTLESATMSLRAATSPRSRPTSPVS
jgi:hypothetical protein